MLNLCVGWNEAFIRKEFNATTAVYIYYYVSGNDGSDRAACRRTTKEETCSSNVNFLFITDQYMCVMPDAAAERPPPHIRCRNAF